MSEDNNSTNNKNTSEEYDNVLKEIKNRAQKNAKSDVGQLYDALKKEGLDPRDAGDRIKHDLTDTYSVETIRRHLPQEAKRKYEREEEQIGQVPDIADKKQLVQVTSTGEQQQQQKKEPSKPDIPSSSTRFIPLPTTTPKLEEKPNFKKARVSYDFEIRGQIIPLSIVVYVNLDTLEIDVDRVETRD